MSSLPVRVEGEEGRIGEDHAVEDQGMALEDQSPGTPREVELDSKASEPSAPLAAADMWPLLLILPLLLLFPLAYDLLQSWLARVGGW